jgi:hypothetical protein
MIDKRTIFLTFSNMKIRISVSAAAMAVAILLSTETASAQSGNSQRPQRTYKKKYYKEGDNGGRRRNYVVREAQENESAPEEKTAAEHRSERVTDGEMQQNAHQHNHANTDEHQGEAKSERADGNSRMMYRREEAGGRKEYRRKSRKEKWSRSQVEQEETSSK